MFSRMFSSVADFVAADGVQPYNFRHKTPVSDVFASFVMSPTTACREAESAVFGVGLTAPLDPMCAYSFRMNACECVCQADGDAPCVQQECDVVYGECPLEGDLLSPTTGSRMKLKRDSRGLTIDIVPMACGKHVASSVDGDGGDDDDESSVVSDLLSTNYDNNDPMTFAKNVASPLYPRESCHKRRRQ